MKPSGTISKEKMNTNMAAAIETEQPSVAVQQLREMHDHGKSANAEDDAQGFSNHIRAIDRELEALSKERGEIAEQCFKAAEQSRTNCDRAIAVAKDEYRDAPYDDIQE